MSVERIFLSFFNEWNLKRIHALDANISAVYETSEALQFDVEYAPNIRVVVTLPLEIWKRRQVSFGSKVMYPPDNAGVLFFLSALKNTRKDAFAFEQAFNTVNKY
jgi:hypothetical protein